MKVIFELRKEKATANGLIPIQFVIRAEGIRIRKNAGFSTKESYWTGSRVKPNLKKEEDNNYQFINDELQKIESKVNDIFFFFRANKIPFSKDTFLEKFESKQSNSKSKIDFFECFEEYLTSGKLSKAYNTIKAQTTIKNFLKMFEDETGFIITFEKLDGFFYEELMRYSFLKKEIKNNYFAKIIAVLKSFSRWALDKNYHTNREFEKFKGIEHDVDIIYLTFDELMLLYNRDFENSRLNHTKDFYCMGCFTGLRFSDLSQLHKANITENHINISIQKTKTQNHIISLNKYSKQILRKYKDTIYEPLPSISQQKFNDYIKECCEIVKINKPTTTTGFTGTKKIQNTVPKYELITSHTARKTFITNSLLLGMEPKAIKKIANIKKDAVLDKYMKITEEYTDEQMNKWN
ncbi:site-specific integrase [Flavobacterium sp. TAB 87]|uniref:site-specific integrase n=1 Tax=Flavobacterium sp. TAB 87 TaxID=1729581 RepID=UPI00076D1020|nr:site-specific integrase [Flavobacterium sp. TAB 87]KVV13403.1 tyrosine recombinase XerC [Flavobacterium sp. TAB 87]